MGARVAVAGASGYAGGELLRLLAGHPDLEVAAATADSSAGKTIGEVHAHLAGVPGLASRVLEPSGSASLADCDLVFAALPAGQSAVLAAALPAAVKMVDLGPDFRLADPDAWDRHYGGAHPGRWVTGLPELPGQRAAISAASRVAAPGCYATAAIMALVPVVAAGLADPQDVVVVAASRHLRRGPVAADGPAGQRGHGVRRGLQRGRHAPAHGRDHPGPQRAGRGGRDRVVHAGPGPDAARHPGHLHRAAHRARRQHRGAARRHRRRLRGRPVRVPAARGPLARHRVGGRLQRRPPAGRRRRPGRPGRRGGRHRQPRQGRGQPGHPGRQPDARPARGSRA